MFVAFIWWWLLTPGMPAASLTDRPLIVGRSGIDFGDVTVRSQNQAWLRLQNASTHRIRIMADGADCNCLTNQLSVSELEPSDLADWNVQLNTCDYIGEVHRNIWIQTDDPKLPTLRLPVRYHVLPEVYTEPQFVPLGLIDDDDVDLDVAIYSTSEVPIHLFSPHASDPRIELRLSQPLVMADAPASLHVRVNRGFVAEPFNGECFVQTSAADIERIRIPIFGEGATGVYCSVRELDFGIVPLGAAAEQTIAFSLDPDVELVDVRTADKDVAVTRLDRNDGSICATVTTSASLPLGTLHGSLFIETRTATDTRIVRFAYRGRIVERTVFFPDYSSPVRQRSVADLVGLP